MNTSTMMKKLFNYILMLLQKWNPDKHIYEPFESPANDVLLFTKDMTKIVDCANC